MAAKVSIKFYLLTTRATKGELPIYLRITMDRKKAELHSGYTCTPKEWIKEEQLTKSNNTINNELAKTRSKVYELIIDLEKMNKSVSATLIKELLSGKEKIEIGLIAYFNRHIEEIRIKNEIKDISINKYTQSINTLIKFIQKKFKKEEFNIDQVDYEFINAYDLFLRETHSLHKNTINKYHSRLRTILLKALAEGHLFKQPYANFKLNSVKTDREFLSQDELNKIIKLDLSHNNKGFNKLFHFTPSHFDNIQYHKIIPTHLFNDFIDTYRDPENEIRIELGLPKIGEGWISETKLFYLIKERFKNFRVIQHGKPKWLGRQHLDIYLPDFNVGIEYQGEQHSISVEIFGGKTGLKNNKERDLRKKSICQENHLRLFEVFPDDDFKKFVDQLSDLLL